MKKYTAHTPTTRNTVSINYRELLTTSEPHKPLTYGSKRHVGRDNAGRISVRHQGGGHKRLQRDVDFKYNKVGIPAKIETIEYDPNRSGFIGLVCYADGERRYILLPQGLKVGETIMTDAEAPLKPGNRLPLKKIPSGTFIYNLELKPQGGAKIVRSGGSYAEVLANDAGYTNVKMPSSEVRKIIDTAWASIGAVSNEENKLVKLGKAGRSRWLGIRPTVRGSAMNPVDHPYGGGEGRQGRGTKRPKTLWGKVTGGRKTRRAKKYSNSLIVSRRVKKGRKK
ncbi:MAG: 50S ribosomal protein L2 [Candidatus Pacebacteria bacterium]|nr:50S ribosomal protein L2 [Candidatus Paceibacterota bacterium]